MIEVIQLSKTYRVPERDAGVGASLRSVLRRRYQDVHAVRAISFTIAAGEIVGFLGPNGAGKTTTLKMLAGLMYPGSGQATVAGFVPWQRRPAYLRQISMVLGNKSQLLWDIPPLDTFHVLGEIYGIAPAEQRRTIAELSELLDVGDLLRKPVRNASLGERMKCELIAGLLHRPSLLFLDEPTLGLDVSMQGRLRSFVAEYNRRTGATVILTSHYMADVMALCPRILFIDHGQLLYDGGLSALAERLAPFKLIRMMLRDEELAEPAELPEGIDVVERERDRLTLRVDRGDVPVITARLLQTLPIADLSVEDPPIEAVIDRLYQGGAL